MFAAAAAFGILLCAPAHADKRVALVVGNANYTFANKLDNPTVDARAVRDALKKLDFTVVYGEDLDKSALEKRLGEFALAVRDADVAIVYFAGHGATFGDIPYVVPVDAEFDAVEKIPYELVPVESLIGELRRAKGVRIAILDACRDNKAEEELKREDARRHGGLGRGSATTRGLAKVENTNGLIVAYATQYLTTASDGPPGGDSPFTAALIRLIGTPNLDIKDMFFRVARAVIDKTGGRQRPEISVSLYDNYELVPEQGETSAAVEELLRQAGVTYGGMSYEPATSTVTIKDIVREAKDPGDPTVKIAQLTLTRLVLKQAMQFSAQRIEAEDEEIISSDGEKGTIDRLTLENVSLGPAALQLGRLAALAELASASAAPISPRDIITRVVAGLAGIHIGKLEVGGVNLREPTGGLKLGTLTLNNFENGKFSDLVLNGLSIVEPGGTVQANRIALKGFDLANLLRISEKYHNTAESRAPDQAGELMTLLDGVEIDDLTVPDQRPGLVPGQAVHIELGESVLGTICRRHPHDGTTDRERYISDSPLRSRSPQIAQGGRTKFLLDFH